MAEPSNTIPPETSYDEPQTYGQESRTSAFEAEDQRWRRPWTDWLLLVVMIAVSLGYHFAIFLAQPGLR